MHRITLAALLFCMTAAAAGDITIRNNGGAFQVTGWRASAEPAGGWQSIFTVTVGTGDVPPMLGSYSVESGVLTFRPKWPVAPGVRVRAAFRPAGAAGVDAEFETPGAKASPSTSIAHVYPSAGELPENALRMYIYFSAPMQRGEAWQHIHLLDESGQRVELPFLEVDQELWDPGNTRLTVLFDPGRIKRGLVPLRDSGPNILEGKRYTLEIDPAWKDAAGQALTSGIRKPLLVTAPLRDAIDIAQWKFQTPAAESSDPLVILFPRPLDYALAQRMITVAGVKGTVTLDRNETEWRFVPAAPWKAGDYTLTVDTALEDVAGNRVDRPFDVDTFTEVTKEITSQSVSMSFTIKRK